MKQYRCSKCSVALTPANAPATVLAKGGYCRTCAREYNRQRYGPVRKTRGLGRFEYGSCSRCGKRSKGALCYKCLHPTSGQGRHGPIPLYQPTDRLDPARRVRMIAACRERDGNSCAACGETMDDHSVTVDRIVPGSHGGKYELANCQLMHVRCNARKGDRTEDLERAQKDELAQLRLF